MKDDVPSLSLIVDQLQVRLEYAQSQGLADEEAALRRARETIVNHVFREHRNRSIIYAILSRLRIKPAA